MKPNMQWQFRPYMPIDRINEADLPYVCRLAPFENGFSLELLDNGCPGCGHTLFVRLKDSQDPWQEHPICGSEADISGLEADADYEFYVIRTGDPAARCRTRYVRTGFYPDIIVNYVHPQDPVYGFSGHYLCDPTFVRVPSGALVAAMDVYAPHGPQNMEILFRSEDNGRTWKYLCDLIPSYWGTLFFHRGVLYMLCTSTENGHLMIGASYDEGYTWTRPHLLFVGGNTQGTNGFQRQPMPFLVHQGRIMTSIEFGSWPSPTRYGIATLSAPEDADLLDPESWTLSDLTHYDPAWPDSPKGGTIALLEGSLYVAKDNRVLNLLRMQINDCVPNHGKACLLTVDPSDPEAAPGFVSVIDMPTGANSRTHILQDPVEGKYWGIGNLVTADDRPWQRNVMALVVSEDGYAWRVAKLLLDYRDTDFKKVGFQYTSFIFDGSDILYLSRTAFNGANSFHDSNCQTFGIVRDFRKLGELPV